MVTGIAIRLAFPGPVITPDSLAFEKLADNLIVNHCYSLSDPVTAACQPSWGSQPPGYTLLIATTSKLLGPDLQLVVIAQIVIFSIAAAYALWSAYTWHGSRLTLVAASVVLAFSPLTTAWSRWVLTETLAASAALWVLAEIFRSLHFRKLKKAQLGVAVMAAVMVRWDMVWMVIPGLILAISFYGYRKAAGPFLLTCIPTMCIIGLLVLRAGLVGLPLIPGVLSDPSIPSGVTEFWNSGAKTQDATSGFLWPIWSHRYKDLRKGLNTDSFEKSHITPEFKEVLDEISQLGPSDSLPIELNEKLENLSRSAKLSGQYSKAGLLLKRSIWMWIGRDHISLSGWRSVSKTDFPVILNETLARDYRVVLVLILLGLGFLAKGTSRLLITGTVACVLLRTLFLSSLTAVEIRYLTPVIPVMELVVISVLVPILISFYRKKTPI